MKDHLQVGGKSIKLKDISISSALLLAKEIVNNMNNRKTRKANSKPRLSKTKKRKNEKTS
jgi:hypothetical protein